MIVLISERPVTKMPTTYPPLRPGFFGAHDKFEAADLYREEIAKAKGNDDPISEDYLRSMGKKAGFPEKKIEEDIARLHGLRRHRQKFTN